MSEHIATDTSSIHASWPPVPSTHNRLRGFYDDRVLRSEIDVACFAEVFRSYRDRLLADSDLSRLSIRCVSEIGSVALLAAADLAVEGLIPFRRLGQDLALVYAGWNRPNRRLRREDIARHTALLHITEQRSRNAFDAAEIMQSNGLTPHIIDRNTPAEARAAAADRFNDLYAAFNYNEANVQTLLNDPSNTVAYAETCGTVVSTAMAEAGTVDVHGIGAVRLTEITEAYTRLEYRGRGLYKAISAYLCDRLLNDRAAGTREMDILYGESNLSMPGVVFAAHENGRRFSHFDAARFGFPQHPAFGILPQNFSINDGTKTREYNDFALSYVPLP